MLIAAQVVSIVVNFLKNYFRLSFFFFDDYFDNFRSNQLPRAAGIYYNYFVSSATKGVDLVAMLSLLSLYQKYDGIVVVVHRSARMGL